MSRRSRPVWKPYSKLRFLGCVGVIVAGATTFAGLRLLAGQGDPLEADGAKCNQAPNCNNTCVIGSSPDTTCKKAGPNNLQEQCITATGGNGNVFGTKCEQNNNAMQDCNPWTSTDKQQSQCLQMKIWKCGCLVDNGMGGQSHTVCDYSNCPCMGDNNGGNGTIGATNSCT